MVGSPRAPDALLVRTARHVPGVIYQYRLDPDGHSCFPQATDGIRQIYEVTPEEVREDATVVFGRLHSADLEAVSQAIQHSAETLTVWRQEYRVVLPERGERWLRGEASPQRLESGAVLWHGYITDITENKRVEAAREESDALFRGLFEAMDQGVVILGAGGETIDVNPAAVRILGPEGARWCGSEHGCRLTDADGSALSPEAHPAGEALRTGRPVLGRTVGVVRSGEQHRRWLVLDAHPRIRPGAAHPDRVICVFTDVTTTRRVQEELEAAKEAALAASRAKSTFLATMSHEIRTPMNGVVGAAELLRTTGLDAQQVDLVETIESSTELLMSVINDVLDFSRIESGHLHLEDTPFDLRKVVCATIDALSSMRRNVDLQVEIDDALPEYVSGDAFRLRQILNNLVGNALKFTEAGHVRVRVRPVADGLTLEVEDTGIGVAQDRLPTLFEPFVQADSSTARRYGGTGLGLSITKRLVDLMDGRISVTSQPSEGTCFTIFLPSRACAAPPPEPRLSSGPHALDLRILVAEDNRINQTIVRRMLEASGAEVEVVDSGRAAVEACRSSTWHLVLMDVQMPDMDGFEATREIRRHEADGQRVPIVALTANAMAGDREDCLAAGMDDYLSKPVRREDLARLLERLSN